jgi:hypothetical protein
MNVVVETVPNEDRRPLVVIVGAKGIAVRRRRVLKVVGLAALAVEPAVAVGQRRVGRTGLAWICIPRPGVLCDHRDPPLPLNGIALSVLPSATRDEVADVHSDVSRDHP